MKILIALLTLIILTPVYGQTLLKEYFNSDCFPPEGWTISSNGTNWEYSYSREAEGENLGEAKLNSNPFFTETSRLISPVINTSEIGTLIIEFRQRLFFAFGNNSFIGISTRSNNSNWHTVWEKQLTNDIVPQLKRIIINSEDVGSDEFQFCMYFKGKSYQIRQWYIDDIRLYSPYENDISITTIKGKQYLSPGEIFNPVAVIENIGITYQSPYITCNIYKSDNKEFIYTDTIVTGINPDELIELDFSPFLIPATDEFYTVTVKVSGIEDMDTTNNFKSKYIYSYSRQRQNVILEIGTGVTCGYCPGVALGADDLVENGKPVSVIEYHYFDHNNDPFSNSAAETRTNYYHIFSYPTSFFDGIIKHKGGSISESLYEVFLPKVEERMAVNTPVSIKFSTKYVNKGYSVVVNIIKLAPVLDTSFVLNFVITESDIEYEWENQQKLNFVERIMLPDAKGIAIDLKNNDTVTHEYYVEIQEEWNPENLEIVAFIQNQYNKEIINGYSEKLLSVNTNENTFVNNINNKRITIFPNPASEIVNVGFNIYKSLSFVNIKIYDINGKLTADLLKTNMRKGEHIIQWKPEKNIRNGLYIVQTTINNETFVNELIIK
jgi:hypothetical protein